MKVMFLTQWCCQILSCIWFQSACRAKYKYSNVLVSCISYAFTTSVLNHILYPQPGENSEAAHPVYRKRQLLITQQCRFGGGDTSLHFLFMTGSK